MAIVVEGPLAHATAVVHAVHVVEILAPAHLLGRGGDRLHVLTLQAAVQLGNLGHLAVLILDAAGALLVVIGVHAVVTEVGALFGVGIHAGFSLSHGSLLHGEVGVLLSQLGLEALNFLISGCLLGFGLNLRYQLLPLRRSLR